MQRNSKVNDMTINNREPVLDVNEIAKIKHKDKIEIVNGVIYEFQLLQQDQWKDNIPDFLLPSANKAQRQRKSNNIDQYAMNHNKTPPPPRTNSSHRHRKSTEYRHKDRTSVHNVSPNET